MTSASLRKSNCRQLSTDATQMPVALSTDALAELDARRRTLGISRRRWLAEANIDVRVWERARAGQCEPQHRTLVKLSRALDRIAAGGPAPAAPPSMVAAFWRIAVAFFARELGADPALALDDRGQSCPQDPAWLSASRARQLAFYVTHVELSVTLSALAAAIGTSKQRVHKAVCRVEDLRDVLDLDVLLDRASTFLSGRTVATSTAGTFGKGIVP